MLSINRELALLRQMLRLAARHCKAPRVPMLEVLYARRPAPASSRPIAVRPSAPPSEDLPVAVTYTYGWRTRCDVLPLERRYVDLRTGKVRFGPGGRLLHSA